LKLNFIHHEKSKPTFVCKTVDIVQKKRKLKKEPESIHSPLVQSIRRKVVLNKDDIEEELPPPPPQVCLTFNFANTNRKRRRKERKGKKLTALHFLQVSPFLLQKLLILTF
jgi:hypothetical protein